jgi:4-amino-4-deoxy-L-arabinose transferase-like glycosyltransferase
VTRVRALVRRAFGRLPAACWACAAIAFANAALWATVTPPYQVPDEVAHLTYVQHLAEWKDLPGGSRARGSDLTSEEVGVAAAAVPFNVEGRPTWSAQRLRRFREIEAGLDRRPGSTPPSAINNPPLYYLLAAVPYRLARSADALDVLFAMRLLSAILAAITVAASFMFVRELLPGRRWAPTVGALAVAFQPMFGFMSGGVNNDNLLYALAAVFIYLVARALRRGVDPGLALALGGVAAAGVLTKTSFVGLLPGGAFGVLVALLREPAPRRLRSLAGVAGGAAVFVVVTSLWLAASSVLFDRGASRTTAGLTDSYVTSGTSLRGHLSYIWQVFLPALPGMQGFPSMADSYPLWDTFVQGFVGRFGWWRFGFPPWVNQLGLGIYVGVVALAGAGLVRARAALRGRRLELLSYGLVAAGYVLLVEVAAYRYQVVTDTSFEQARYLLPLLPFYGGLVAVAATAGGRRWGPPLGAFLVVVAMAHSLFAMLLVVGHYYG